MESENFKKRIFFACQVASPWPENPPGRAIANEMRHMTLVFIGKANLSKLFAELPSFPKPPMKIGKAGYFDQCLFLPEERSRVVAWHMHFLHARESLINYCEEVASWLKIRNFIPDTKRPFLPHTTVARRPFEKAPWLKSFVKLPFFIKNFVLYESLPFSNYQVLWDIPLLPPFEEFEHTADIAFKIIGENYAEVFVNALIALAFRSPEILSLVPDPIPFFNDLDEIIIYLNEIIARTDAAVGCPFKAISFHGKIEQADQLLGWEMIVDV